MSMASVKTSKNRRVSYFERTQNEKEQKFASSKCYWHKVSRKLPEALIRAEVPNKHYCGLFNYVWIVCHASTYINEEKGINGGYDNKFAYLNTTARNLKDAFNIKTTKEIFKALDQLKSVKLIDYKYNGSIKNTKIQIVLLNRKSHVTKGIRSFNFEKSAIKDLKGYVFIDYNELIPLFKQHKRGLSARDAMIYFWMNSAYREKKIPVTNKCAFVCLNKRIDVKSRDIASMWKCAPTTVLNDIKLLEDKGFVQSLPFHSLGTFIMIPCLTELLWNEPSEAISRKDIEVEVLGHDPNPIIQKQKEKAIKYASIAKFYKKEYSENKGTLSKIHSGMYFTAYSRAFDKARETLDEMLLNRILNTHPYYGEFYQKAIDYLSSYDGPLDFDRYSLEGPISPENPPYIKAVKIKSIEEDYIYHHDLHCIKRNTC